VERLVIDPALLTRLAAILPGEWTAIPHGYRLDIPNHAVTVRTPGAQYLVHLEGDPPLKSYKPEDLPTLIRRVLGDEVFTALATGTDAAKADRDRRRSELNHLRQTAEATLHQAQDALTTIEAQIAAFDRENP
jgi:hypothetical protein